MGLEQLFNNENLDLNSFEKTVYETATNEEIIEVNKPIFDHEGGFYTDPFYLRIEVPENTTVYYTTDSSDPDAHSSRYNNEPIYIYNKSNEDNNKSIWHCKRILFRR